jgi:hypothetical protein
LLPIVKNRPHEFNDLLRYFSLGDEIDTFIKRNKIINLVNDIVNNEEIINYSPDSMEEWHNLYPEN